jgi:phosphoglycolate phosphatase
MLDCDLFRILLEGPNKSAVWSEFMPALVAEAQRQYLADCPPTLTHCVCPGVVNFLERLAKAGIPCGIVSGNLSGIGRRKLELAGLSPYFRIAAFSEQGKTRADLVAVALGIAKQRGYTYAGRSVTLIGDHPNDVRAARANGIRAIAVATGLSAFEELRQEDPDLLLEDLTSLSLEQLR